MFQVDVFPQKTYDRPRPGREPEHGRVITLLRRKEMRLQTRRPDSDTKFALSLALVTLLAPVGTDLYLASMPDIARHLDATYASVQFTLSVYLLAQGMGQVLFGPVIDRFGRRLPLLIGIVVFTLASVWGGFSGSIFSLLASRFIQGLAGSLLLVVGFSSVRDVTEGVRAARLFAILLTIEGLAPIFAPIAGGYIDAYFGWRVVLWSSAAMGIAAFANSFFHLPESLDREKRLPLKPAVIYKTYARIGTDRHFLLPTLALSGVFFFLFAYIGGGAFLYQDMMGLSPDEFGLVFGITGIAVMAGAMAGSRLVRKFEVVNLALAGIVMILAGTGIAFGSWATAGLPGMVAGFMVAMFGLGLAEPTLVSLTMGSQDKAMGFTAALMGCLHLVLSSFSTPVSGFLLPLGAEYWFMFLLAAGGLTLGITLATKIDVRSLARMKRLSDHAAI